MSQDQTWDDEARDTLRATLQFVILGETRLAKLGRAQILQLCREGYIEEVCPDVDQDAFLKFVANELNRAEIRHQTEMATWPAETDSDRLDRVESVLQDRGILLWQASPCCDSCTYSELRDRIQVIDSRCPGFGDRMRGYAFFVDQAMPESLAEGGKLSIYLAFGWVPHGGARADKATYEKNAIDIAHEVCECLRKEGFDVDWDGSIDRKICTSLNWQRRSMLE